MSDLRRPAAASAPRTVLYVLDTMGLSGRTKGIIDLALALDPARYRPVFCALGAESSTLSERLTARGVPIEVLEVPPGLRFSAVRGLAGLIRRHGATVVNAVNPRPMLYAGLAARLLGLRATVGTLSAFACQVPDREYKFLPQELANRGRSQALRNEAVALLMRNFVAVSIELGERFCRFTADRSRPLTPVSYDRLMRKLRAISYGIEFGQFERVTSEDIAALRAELRAGPDTVLVGSVGRLVEQKDYPTQIGAFAIAARQEPRLHMVLAGEGPLRAAIEAQATELGIRDRITLLGQWTRVAQLLRTLDVFVLASKFEPYGVALLEAKCAGTAIVSTSVNEIPHLLEDGVTGLLVPAESPEPMAEAFLRLARDPALRRQLGDGALGDARRRHTIEAVATAYQSLYDDALRG